MIKLPNGIQANLQFLCVEVDSQLANMQMYFEQISPTIAHQILERVGYAYNLKTSIHSDIANQLTKTGLNSQTILMLRSIEFIANDLEHITEVCRNCIVHTEQNQSFEGMIIKMYISLLKQIQRAVSLIMPAIEHADSELAIEIGQIHYILEQKHKKLLNKHIAALKAHKDPAQLTQALFVAYEFKQIGASLVRICESIISANLGQPVSFDRYFSLQALVSDIGEQPKKLQIETVAETRSGSAISGISGGNNGYLGIYKGGQKKKLKDEKNGVKSWHEIYPGLAPKILSYKKKGESAALLIEHLPGYTFEQIVINESPELLQTALKQLKKTLRSIWTHTQIDKSESAHFMQQLKKRLPEVYAIHPEFYQRQVSICGQSLPDFDTLIEQAETLEAQWPPSFSVYIHGDFNIDNIIYDPTEKRVNFIDLHRSRYMDYVQDVAIFMVSNYRLQIFDTPRRKQIMSAAMTMYAMAHRYSVKQQDESFDLRLALGLARAFATSTRFILDKSLAREMFMRARYLIELVLTVEVDKVSSFRIPLKEIFVE
jgi:aminoglycoside phosphotransferase (APT) family kinase protein